MADVNAKIGVSIDASAALAELKSLQRQLAAFHSSLSKGSAASVAAQKNLSTNLLNSINSTGKFTAQMGLVRSSTESFTHSLEKNKLSMREYFRYAGGSTKTFGKLFSQEFNTIGKVAEERVKKMQTQYIKMGRDASGAIKAMSITPRTLDMNDYATKTALAAQKQALFNQLLKQGSTNLLNFGKNTQWAGRQLMVGFTIPLAYFGTTASKTFMDLEKQAIKFKRVYGDMFTTADETNKALGDIQKLAESFTKYGVAVTETMEMAASAAAMGKMGAELTAQVAEATRLAVLGGVEQAQALETTISVTNAFGIASEDLASKINFLNAVENQTILSIEDLTVAMPKAGPVVKQLGGSVEDLAFFMTAMKEGGINASEGANALKSGLASLINPSKKASEMLAGFGVNIKGIVEANQGDIKNTVIGFAQALDTLDPLNRARAIEQLFGKFQFSRLSTLFQNVTKEGTQANKVLQLTNASIEELAILAERELGTIENAIGVDFKESVEKLKLAIAPIGKTFLEAITPIATVLGKMLAKFNDLGEGTKKFIVIASTLVGVIGPVLLMTFGLVLNAGANIIKLFATMRAGFLKSSSGTKILAEQTNYLNSEQMEAATVATSLNQAHNKLTQSFTVEAVAVKALRQAYLDATIAATNFARANPGMMGPGVIKGGKTPKKYAKGIPTVPGTGNKDTVPSLLTPGEAVLPTSVSQNPAYQPIIQGMIDGTLQEFNEGTPNAQIKNSPQLNKTVFAHAVDNRVLSGSNVPSSMQAAGFTKANAFSAIGFDVNPSVNSRLISNKVPVSEYLSEIKSPLSTQTMTSRLIDLGASPKEAARVTETMKNNLIKSLEPLPQNRLIGDSDIYSRMGNLKTGILGGMVKKSEKGLFGNSVKQLYANTTFSQSGKSLVTMNSTAPIGAVIDAVKKTKTRQSSVDVLRNLQKIDPNLNIPVRLDANGNITAYSRPEISKTTGKMTSTKNVGVLSGDKFIVGRENRGGGRKLKVSKNARQLASQELLGTTKNSPQSVRKGSTIIEDIRRYQQARYNREDNALLEAMRGGTKSGVVTGQTGIAKPSSLNVLGGGPNDTRQIAVGKGEAVLTQKTTSSLRAGKQVFIPGMGRLGIFGADGGIPGGQTQGGSLDIPFSGTKPASAKLKEYEQNMKISAKQLDSKIEMQKKENKMTKQSLDDKRQLNKFTKAEIKNQRSMSVGRVAGPIAGIAGTASMAGYMTGNAGLGNAMMGLSALAMAAQMVTGKFSAIAVSAALVATTVILLRKEFDKARKEAIEMNKATGASSQAIDKYAKFSNKVTASEIMDRRRSQKFALTQTAAGKTTFGGAFVQTEDGKALAESFAKQISSKNGNIQTSVQDLTSQLSTSVLAGALTADQAKSIAVNLADELGNMSLGLQVTANLTELLGPDGKNILTNGIEIRAKMIQDQQNKVANSANAFGNNKIGNFASQKKIQIAGTGSLAAGGAATGALIGSAVPVVGTAVGLVVGAAIGAGIGYAVQKSKSKVTGALAGALVADMETALQVQSQLQDALTVSFEKRIKEAKAAGDTAKAYELQLQYTKEKNALDAKGLELNTQIMDIYKNAGSGQEALLNGIKQDAKDAYKGTNESKYVDSAQALLGNARKTGISREQEALINLQISSKTLKPSEVTSLFGMFEGKEKETKLIADILVNRPKLGSDVSTILGLITDKQGVANEQLKTEVLVAISAAKTDQDAQRIIDLVGAIGQFGGILDADVAIDFYMKNKGLAEQFLTTWEELQSAKNITLDVVYDIDYRLKGQIDEEYFKTLKGDDDKKIYTKTISLIYNADVETVINGDDYKAWLPQNKTETDANGKTYQFGGAEFAGKNLTSAQMIKEYANDVAKSAVETGVVPPQTAPATTVNTGTRQSTPYDSILTDLKRTRNSKINAEGGAPELMRILGKNKDIKIFNGLDQQLAKAGANTDFIDWVGGLEKAIQNKLIKVAKDGTVAVTALGKAAQKAFDEKQLGSFAAQQVNAIEGAKAQRTAFVKLTAAGMDQAQALELVADANFAVAISRVKDIKELKELIKLYQDAEIAVKGTARANDPIRAFRDDMDKINEMLDVQERQAKAKYQPEIDRVNGLIEANEKAIEAKQRYSEMTYDRPIQKLQNEITELNYDLSLIEKTASTITEKYDEQREALEQVYSINSRIADQQKAKISLADALTSGDISQAAQIVQDIRSQEQTYAKEESLNALEIAQTNEINALRSTGGLSKLQIEEKIYTLGQDIYSLEQKQKVVTAEIVVLQDKNYDLKVGELAKAQGLLDNEIKLIEKSRLKYAEAELAIKSAEVNTDDYTEALKRSEEVLKRMAILWASLGSKTSADLGAITGAVEDPKDKGVDKKAEDKKAEDKPPAKTNLISVTAKSGQTLSSIAKANNTTVKELLAINPVLTSNPKYNNGNTIFNGTTVKVPGKMYGGVVSGSGMLDKVPTMLTPGEFVMNRAASQKFGPLLERMNESKYPGSMSLGGNPVVNMVSNNSANNRSSSVYNYSLNVGVNGTSASPDDIARTVITQIRHMDARRLRGNTY
jgi:TP901 family phage tail tape measure protein